ncbi:unnamed protein product [Angiostrongylus costaricensis]|uniref:MG2 domain-containing protein n=1 Tax=Angiostrongylus costaricensis TaxID=334426 RepID=A0A158PM52_ANGCS|nr:unnamed protein product [Angiostrongylus costaricensis]
MKRLFHFLWLLFYISIVVDRTSCSVIPFVVLPPLLRHSAVNTIVITPTNTEYETVDIHVVVIGFQNGANLTVFDENLKAKRSGTPHVVSFHLPKLIEKAKIAIRIQDLETFESEIQAKPNLAVLHIHTDKPIYSAGEKVFVRALPLTHEGAVYDGLIEFALVNPSGFELVRKQNSTADGYIALTFELPKHLFYGEWHVLARPMPANNDEFVFDAGFKVNDYDVLY